MGFWTSKEQEAIKKATSQAEDLFNEIEAIKDAAQDRFDGKSEKWQEGEVGEAASGNLSELDDLVSALESAKDACNDVENWD